MIYFSYEEMACRCGCGAMEFAPGFEPMLDGLRGEWGWPAIVTSGCRCPAHNKAEGGHKNSLHLTINPRWGVATCAVDIERPDSKRLADLVRVALSRKFSVGIAGNFVHLDWRTPALERRAKLWIY